MPRMASMTPSRLWAVAGATLRDRGVAGMRSTTVIVCLLAKSRERVRV